jgi:hypothetical protein
MDLPFAFSSVLAHLFRIESRVISSIERPRLKGDYIVLVLSGADGLLSGKVRGEI